ncbi:GntR family transcriptional regulator [Oceanobacillus polygoni]|uniref:DNA-binding GntR family transcriptional regulator n=1 Tax=Oceanobacillus polygoni TaxID=1235259 RepID=A0A9X0YR91_9BACI|nr:GntR family transcriptional regulator [Oceanobacillus polygoni]MBP2075794.1 DNA-binding GntR family transcriptional regulator [Oceanobacillus polygoni]
MSLERKNPYYVQFYQMIKQMIFEGKIKPGERINETQFAKEYNVSKSPIREAIRILEKEGLLVVDRSKVIVYKPTLKDVEDIYYCRMALESFAVKRTTSIASDQELQQIEAILDETEAAINANEDANTIIALNEQFHHYILNYSQNPRLLKQVNDLKGLINYYRILNFKGDQRAEEILKQHRQVFRYIKDRNESKAAEEMIQHLEMDVEHLLEIFSGSTEIANLLDQK